MNSVTQKICPQLTFNKHHDWRLEEFLILKRKKKRESLTIQVLPTANSCHNCSFCLEDFLDFLLQGWSLANLAVSRKGTLSFFHVCIHKDRQNDGINTFQLRLKHANSTELAGTSFCTRNFKSHDVNQTKAISKPSRI